MRIGDLNSPRNLILAVETSSRTGSVAIADHKGILTYRPFTGQLQHNTQLLPTVRAMLKQLGARSDQVTQVYIACGPGSFTGIRMAVTMAKTMHLALGTKVVALDSLDVIAANVPPEELDDHILISILDAKMGRFFVAAYCKAEGIDQGQQVPGLVKLVEDTVATSQQIRNMITELGRTALLVGDGLLYYRKLFTAPDIVIMDREYWGPTALNVYRLGRIRATSGLFEDPLKLVPK
jgi:tRNA threonylcarbamoyladenosine biosynthesis protein TsaB